MGFIKDNKSVGLKDTYVRLVGCHADKTHINLVFGFYVDKEAAAEGKEPIQTEGFTFEFSKEDPRVQTVLGALYELAKTSEIFKDAQDA